MTWGEFDFKISLLQSMTLQSTQSTFKMAKYKWYYDSVFVFVCTMNFQESSSTTTGDFKSLVSS